MKNWKHIISFKSFWSNDKISIYQKGKLAAKRLKFLTTIYPDDLEIQEILEDFENITGDGQPEDLSEFTVIEDFDARMNALYDWADNNSVWIDTF